MQIHTRLTVLKQFFSQHKRLPTYREAAKLWEVSSPNAAFKIMAQFIEEGQLEKDETGKLIPAPYFFALPFEGSVPAGFPVPVDESDHTMLSIHEYLVDNPTSTFLLHVSGDSLKDIGVMPGDIALIEKGTRPHTGQVVLARVDGEWTLKILEKRNGKTILMPANTAYDPIIPHHELTIYGVVVGMVRKYKN